MDNDEMGGYFDAVRETMDWEKRRQGLNQRFLEIFQYAFQYARAYGDIYGIAKIDPSRIKSLDDLEKI